MKIVRIVLATLGVVAFLSGCDSACGNKPLISQSSPSGKYQVVVFNRDCGATTGFSTHVSIRESNGALPNDAGNVLILDGTVQLSLRWITESRVAIKGVGGAKVFKQERIVGGVEVAYE